MPKEGSTLKFQDGQNQFKVPLEMYADLEMILEPMEGPWPNPENSYFKAVNNNFSQDFAFTANSLMGKWRTQVANGKSPDTKLNEIL